MIKELLGSSCLCSTMLGVHSSLQLEWTAMLIYRGAGDLNSGLRLTQQVLLLTESSLQLLAFAFGAKISLYTSGWPQLSTLLPLPPQSQDYRYGIFKSRFIGA